MTVVKLGKFIAGNLEYIPKDMLVGETVPGAIYEIHITCKSLRGKESECVKLLYRRLREKFPGMRIFYIEARSLPKEEITIQFEGSPIAWAVLLAFLPLILGILGIVIIAIAVFLILGVVPGWIYGLIFLGALLLWIAPKIPRWIAPPVKE